MTLAIFHLGTWEIVGIVAVGLLLFGSRLPSIARSLGKSVIEFKKGVKDGAEEYDRAAEDAKKPIGQSPAEDAARAQAQTNEAMRDVTPHGTDRS